MLFRSAADPELRAVLGKAGRAYAERHCDRAALARQYREILDLALACAP